jgi:hypothetical protein
MIDCTARLEAALRVNAALRVRDETTKLKMLRSSPPLSRRALEQVEPISSSRLCYCRSLLRD